MTNMTPGKQLWFALCATRRIPQEWAEAEWNARTIPLTAPISKAEMEDAAELLHKTFRGELGLRPEVLAFARLMEAQLRKHDADRGIRGWANDRTDVLLSRLKEDELVELEGALESHFVWGGKEECEDVAREAAGVANFCMMIADVVGGLEEAAIKPPEGE